MKKYIEIDSSYRNRTMFPNPADYEISISQLGGVPQHVIDPVSEQTVIYPSQTLESLAFYQENYAEPMVGLGTVLSRGYLPYMYQLSDGTVYLDELPQAPTTPDNLSIVLNSTRGVYPLVESDNYYNDYNLRNYQLNEWRTITDSNFVQEDTILQRLIVSDYFSDVDGFHLTVLWVTPNSTPPSNIDKYYVGKYIQLNGQRVLITDYFINSNGDPEFGLETSIAIPTAGDTLEIIADRKTTVTLETTYSATLPSYPAYRYPLPPHYLTAKSERVNNTTETVLHVKVTRQGDTYIIVYLVDNGQTTSSPGYDIGKIYYLLSSDSLLYNTESQVDLGARVPVQNTDVGLALDTTSSVLIVNTLNNITQDGDPYNVTSAEYAGNLTWEDQQNIISGEVGTSVTQTISMLGTETGYLQYTRTDASGALKYYYYNVGWNTVTPVIPGTTSTIKDMTYYNDLGATYNQLNAYGMEFNPVLPTQSDVKLGWWVAITPNGSFVYGGAPLYNYDNALEVDSGIVQRFQFNGTFTLSLNGADTGGYLFGYAVDTTNSNYMISEPGAAQVYYNGVATFNEGSISGRYGNSVSLATSDEAAAIGDPVAGAPGIIWFYELPSTTGISYNASDGHNDDLFGASCQIVGSGDDIYAIVGAPQNSVGGSNRGRAYIFKKDIGFWTFTEQAILTAPDAADGDRFGYSVTLNGTGDIAYIGAPNKSTGQGKVYAFRRSGTAWGFYANILPSDPTNNVLFGFAVSTNNVGDLLLTSAQSFNSGVGKGYLFYNYSQITTFGPGSQTPSFGYSAAMARSSTINNLKVVFGAPDWDVTSYPQGGKLFTYEASISLVNERISIAYIYSGSNTPYYNKSSLGYPPTSFPTATQITSTLVQGDISHLAFNKDGESYLMFIYIGKYNSNLYMKIETFTEVIVATDVSDVKLCKLVFTSDTKMIIYHSLEGLKLLVAIREATDGSEIVLTWKSYLLNFDTSITTFDVVLNDNDCPYIVYGSGNDVYYINLCSQLMSYGVPYTINPKAITYSDGFIESGTDSSIIVSTNLPDVRNQYLSLRNRQATNYTEKEIADFTFDYSNTSKQFVILQVQDFYNIIYNATSGIASSLYFTSGTEETIGNASSILPYSGIPSMVELGDGIGVAITIYSTQLIYIFNPSKNGSGSWSSSVVIYSGTVLYSKLFAIGGYPAVCFVDSTGTLRIATSSSSNGLSGWTVNSNTLTGVDIQALPELLDCMVIDGAPCIVYSTLTQVLFSRNDSDDGTGTWTTVVITGVSPPYYSFNLNLINGYPAVVFTNQSALKKFAINSDTDGLGIWSVETITTSPIATGTVMVLQVLYNTPAVLLQGENDLILARRDAVGVWTNELLTYASDNTLQASIGFIVSKDDLPVYIYLNRISNKLVFKYNDILITEPTQLNEIKLISGSEIVNSTELTVYSPFSQDLETLLYSSQISWEILEFSYDNYNPINYNGTTVSLQQEVCYEIELQRLTLPNKVLLSGFGNRIAFYPYIYVVFEPTNHEHYNIITSNNPNSNHAIFSVGIYNVNSPDRAAFVVLDGRGMTQTIKWKPNQNFRFKVLLPNGDVFQIVEEDTLPPSAPDFYLQTSAVFGFKRLGENKSDC
jgi:hypothetical protein